MEMTILIAYDGRPSSERALDYAVRHSVNYSEPLYILTVVSKEQMDPDPDPSVLEYMEAAQKKAVAEGADSHALVEYGKPDEVIIEIANSHKCDTIVIGRSDKSVLDRFILGSVSKTVIKYAEDSTVIVVPAGDAGQQPSS